MFAMSGKSCPSVTRVGRFRMMPKGALATLFVTRTMEFSKFGSGKASRAVRMIAERGVASPSAVADDGTAMNSSSAKATPSAAFARRSAVDRTPGRAQIGRRRTAKGGDR